MSTIWRHNFFKMKYDLKGHPRSYKTTLCQNYSSTLVYRKILIKNCMNANNMKTQYFFHYIIYDLKCTFMLWRSFVFFFTLRPSDLNTTLTYVIMDNFCPCFNIYFKILIIISFTLELWLARIILRFILYNFCQY